MKSNSSEIKVLSNGLTVVAEHLPAAHSAAVGFFVATGARDETPKEAGVSHFLEHMMFKGTARRSSMDVTLELGNLGAQANAFTSEENTVFYASIVPEKFCAMQDLLSDMLRPSLDTKEYDTERKVILEEIALYQDKPHFYLYEQASGDYFSGHTAGNSVLGTTQSISALARDEMKSYYDRRYSPSNMVLVAAGHFNPQKFFLDAEEQTSSWRDISTKRDRRRHHGKTLQKTYTRKNLTQSHVILISDGPAAQDKSRYAMATLAMILGDSGGSKIYWELIDKGLAESAGADVDDRDGTGTFMVSASTDPQQLDHVTEILRKILSKPLDFSEFDLERAKNKLISKVVLSGELPMGRLMAIGLEWNYRKNLHSLKQLLEEIQAITSQDIQAALEEFPLKAWAEYRLIPE